MAGAAKTADDAPAAPAPAAPAPKRGGLGLIIAAVVTSVAASGGIAWYFTSRAGHAPAAAAEGGEGGEEHAAAKAAAEYLPLDPPFVVNLQDDEAMRFLQVSVEVMTREAKVIDEVKTHMPRIRNALLLLFSQQKAPELQTREAKEKLQAEVLAEIQKVMTDETGKPGVESAYFTSFVMQ